MSLGNWGGSAAGGGFDFQSSASALCLVHMACGTSLGWTALECDIPLSVLAETGGAGDDIFLTLANGSVVEIQAKKHLRDSPELWDSLMGLCLYLHEVDSSHGVLVVGPTTSVAIRNQFARDIVRIGQGRTDDLSPLAIKLTTKLLAASIPLSVCGRLRIQTVHVLEQDGASTRAALAHLAHITSQPGLAWERLKVEGLRLIKLRGRHDAVSVAGIIPELRSETAGGIGPTVVAAQLLDWTLNTTGTFTIPGVAKEFSLDDDWIELKAHGKDCRHANLSSLEEALAHYHEGSASRNAERERQKYDAESLGYFVRQCVIVAGPGMGKSQLLRRIARLLARKREPSLIVRLRPLAERMREGETFLEAILNIGLDASPLKPMDVKSIGMQNLTLLLDGLDESGAEQEEIAKAAVALTASYPRCRIVFATRPIGYETSLLNKWRHYELVPLDSSDAVRSVVRLVEAVDDESATIKKALIAATSHISYKRENSFVAKSPLLIALLASLALNEVIASGTREGLYEQLFKLFERITAAKRQSTSATQSVLSAFLQHLGWELTAQPYADAGDVLAACAQRIAVELGEPSLKARSICDEAVQFWEKAGIVERVRFKVSESLTFVHKTFGEYAAAQYVVSRTIGEREKLLAAIEPSQQWNEVLVFSSSMGLGEDLVQLALEHMREDSTDAERLLRWVRHSKGQLSPELAAMVLQQAWAVIVGPHSGRALRVGIDLVAALDKLPGGAVRSRAYCEHAQWWTALVGWTCFVRESPTLLNFPSLLKFINSYAGIADTRPIGGGFDLFSPVRQLWEELLLPAAREAVRRGVGPEEQEFIDHLQGASGSRSMGFIGDLKFILKKAGVNVQLPEQKDVISQYFNSESYQQEKKDDLALFKAVAEDALEDTVPGKEPLLHLSAFWYGTNLMTMEISAADLEASPFGENVAIQTIKWAARFGSYDYGQLIAEAKAKVLAAEGDDVLAMRFGGLLSVDAPIAWTGSPDSSAGPTIIKALLHPSNWIVYLAANLAEHLLTAAEVAELVPHVLTKSEGLGTVAAANLATQFLGKERARALMVARLKEPLNSGSQFLFEYLAEIWTSNLDDQVGPILTSALSFGPRTAMAALSLARVCSEPHRKALVPILNNAYEYWMKNEGPYPTGSGAIPESPRGAILTLLIAEAAISHDDLFEAVKDRRNEVSKPATIQLLSSLLTSDAGRNELVRRMHAGEALDRLLAECLRARIPFSEQDARSIADLLDSKHPQIRYAAVEILDIQYLPLNEIKKWAEKILTDPYQRLRDKGLERLATYKDVCGDKK